MKVSEYKSSIEEYSMSIGYKIRELRDDAVRLINYIDEGKDIYIILVKAWDIAQRRKDIMKAMAREKYNREWLK